MAVITLEKYRIYSRATMGGGAVIKSTSAGGAIVTSTAAGGAVVKSTSSGGGSTQTSSSGGGVAKSTASGGGSTQTSSAGGGSTQTTSNKTFAALHLMSGVPENAVGTENYGNHLHEVYLPGSNFNHSHTVTIPSHTHTVSIPSHTHDFEVPNHTHNVNIPNHTHEINIPAHTHEIDIPNHTHEINLPNHTHEIEHGIFKLDRMPTKVTIKVDGNTVPITATSGDSIDLIPYLALDSERRVQRGWHTVEITPNDLGRIHAQLMVQFFMQSRGGVDA